MNRLAGPAVPGERYRVERVLAGARLFLAVTSLIAIWLDPTEPSRFETLAYVMLLVYLLHSAAVWLMLRGRHEVSERFCRVVHAVDLLWPAVISVFTEGPNSPFLTICFFALMAAAFRWGFRASFFTTMASLALILAEIATVTWSRTAGLILDGQFEMNRMIIRGAYLVITGLLIGYAAEEEKQLRAENAIIARMAERARSTEGSLSATMLDLLHEVMQVFGAANLMAIAQEHATGRVFCWSVQASEQGTPALRLNEVESDERGRFLTPVAGDAWYTERPPQPGEAWHITAIDQAGKILRERLHFDATAVPLSENARGLLGVELTLGNAWTARVIVRDPRLVASTDTELRFALKMVQQVGPAIYNLYLVRRLRSRAGAIERARAARELHDGAIQSLIAAEMQVDVLRRRASSGTGISELELDRIQQILRQEVLGLRELMQQMRPLDVGPQDLLDFLSETVERFRRDTGIEACFIAELEEVPLPPRVCREVARIAQEALFNIRRHSGARNVLVRFRAEASRWKLLIEDDGRGFSFSGRLTGDEMEATHQGPLVIRERVRLIGGELTIESNPGQGARLEISLPQKTRVAYA